MSVWNRSRFEFNLTLKIDKTARDSIHLPMQMARENVDLEERFNDIKLKFRPARWPRIDLHPDVKEDLIRSFNLFDKNGLGVVSVDAVKVSHWTLVAVSIVTYIFE